MEREDINNLNKDTECFIHSKNLVRYMGFISVELMSLLAISNSNCLHITGFWGFGVLGSVECRGEGGATLEIYK